MFRKSSVLSNRRLLTRPFTKPLIVGAVLHPGIAKTFSTASAASEMSMTPFAVSQPPSRPFQIAAAANAKPVSSITVAAMRVVSEKAAVTYKARLMPFADKKSAADAANAQPLARKMAARAAVVADVTSPLLAASAPLPVPFEIPAEGPARKVKLPSSVTLNTLPP